MSSNPMIKSNIQENVVLEGKPMTIQGAINKTLILVGIVALTALYTWNLCAQGFADKAMLMLAVSLIAGLILAIITSFNPKSSPITAPIYALCEGLVIGTISYTYASMYEGIIINAVTITIITMLTMLLLYSSKTIQATPIFRKVILTSTIAIGIFYFAGLSGALMGHPMTIFNGSPAGIGVSLLICTIAAFNFIIDFDFIEQGRNKNLPEYFEWYSGFALLVTLVWLYLEILRLLAQLSRRD